jgi:hypothetical protein
MSISDYDIFKQRLSLLGISIGHFSSFSSIDQTTIWSWRNEGRKVPDYVFTFLDMMEKLSSIPKKAPLKVEPSYSTFIAAMQQAGYTNMSFSDASKIKKVTLTSWSRVGRKVPGYAYTALWLLQETLSKKSVPSEAVLYRAKKHHITQKTISNKSIKLLLASFIENTSSKDAAEALNIHPITSSLFYHAFRERLNTLMPSLSLIEEADKVARIPLKNNTFVVGRKAGYFISFFSDIEISKKNKDESDEMLDFFDYIMDEMLEYSHFCSEAFLSRLREKTVRYNLGDDVYSVLLSEIEKEPLVLKWQ